MAASIDSSHYPGAIEVVEALLPGDAPAGGEEILLVSHLCHPQPGAHDNASGAAALIETAVTLARLVADGRLPGAAPRHPLYLAARDDRHFRLPGRKRSIDRRRGREGARRRPGTLAGRAEPGHGRSRSIADRRPMGAGGPAPGRGVVCGSPSGRFREPFLDKIRHTETPFSAGSDHYILSDPTVGIPAPMIIHWPDKFYHTSEDTPEKVSPDSLARSGALAAVYAYWLATAGPAEAEWLGHWMVSRFTAWAGRRGFGGRRDDPGAATAAARKAAWVRYHKTNAFRVNSMQAALAQLARIDPGLRRPRCGPHCGLARAHNRRGR